MKSVLVLGAGGMAGHVISLFLQETGEYVVSTLSARQKVNPETTLLDVMDLGDLNDFLDGHAFDVVINCIGSLVKASEERKDRAVYLNAFLPRMLEQRYKDTATRIIHLSTDCVFSGDNPPYREDSAPDGGRVYDRSKLLGEVVNQKDLTFRMSIIGPELRGEGSGLFNWFQMQTGSVDGYTRAVWNGVTTVTLARAIHAGISQGTTGLYHLVYSASVSKFELLTLIQEVFMRQNIRVVPKEGFVSDKTLLNTRNDLDFTVPTYREQLQEMRSWIDNHPQIYTHYRSESRLSPSD